VAAEEAAKAAEEVAEAKWDAALKRAR